MDIRKAISSVQTGADLSRDDMREVFTAIMEGRCETEHLAIFLRALAEKGETVEEIAGAADVMNEKVTRIRCSVDCIDTCGTGGDGISTFNVSTSAAIIASAAGAVVAKHGNRTNTRVSGSAEAIAALGVNIDASIPTLERCLEEVGLAFLYAPNLHPAMKHAGPVRKQLGIRTIFNLLGPLTNPAGAKRQLLGVPRPELTDTVALAMAARGTQRAWVVNAHNGLCDLSITGLTRVHEITTDPNGGRQSRTLEIKPEDVGLPTADLSSLLVDSPQSSADAIRAILDGTDTGPRRHHALLNTGAALVVAGLAETLEQGVGEASRALDSGAADAKLQRLIKCTNT